MKYCKYCGSSIDENAIFCPNCGARLNEDGPRAGYDPNAGYNRNPFGSYASPYYQGQGSRAIAVLSFCFWEVGLILWLIWRYSNPGKARSAAKGALANACFSMPVLGFILWLVWREEEDKKDLAKVCGISAIVGAAAGVITFILTFLFMLSGMFDVSGVGNSGNMLFTFINRFLR